MVRSCTIYIFLNVGELICSKNRIATGDVRASSCLGYDVFSKAIKSLCYKMS